METKKYDWQKYRKFEKEVEDETRAFAKEHDIHFDSYTAEMIRNAMRETRKWMKEQITLPKID